MENTGKKALLWKKSRCQWRRDFAKKTQVCVGECICKAFITSGGDFSQADITVSYHSQGTTEKPKQFSLPLLSPDRCQIDRVLTGDQTPLPMTIDKRRRIFKERGGTKGRHRER